MLKKMSANRLFSKSSLSVIVVFCLVFSLFSAVLAKPAQAKTARAAIVAEVRGNVSIKKAGGSKSYTAYEGMSLNQGDSITTGGYSSIVLKLADHDDEITIDEHAEVSISDLANQGNGKMSRFKLWAGSAWIKVKSLVSSEDEFEVQTPTAVMGVRGTLLFTSVDRVTGETKMVVAAGVVRATTVTAGENEQTKTSFQDSTYATIYPTQQISLDSRTQARNLGVNVDTFSPSDMIRAASPKILEAILKNASDIQKENEELKQKLAQNLANGIQKPEDQSILKITNADDLSKIEKNFDALLANIAKEAVDSQKIDKKMVDEVNKQISDPSKKIDLSKVSELDKNAGLDPEVQKLKNQAKEEAKKFLDEQARLLQNQQKLADLLAKIEKDRKEIEAQNQKKVTDQNKEAASQYIAQLGAEDKKKFEEAMKNNQQGSTPDNNTSLPGGSTSSGSSSSSSSSSRPTLINPTAPTLVAPTEATSTWNPAVVKLKAAADTVIQIMNGSDLVGSANGNGDNEVAITLKQLPVGTYQLMAIAVKGTLVSTPVQLPAITIKEAAPGNTTPDAPILMSPVSDLVTNLPVIVVKAPVNTVVKVLNNGTVIAEANGKGDQPVTIPLDSLVTEKVVVYDKLTVLTELNGIQSAVVVIPKITVDNSMGIELKVTAPQNNKVTASIFMKNFINSKAIYAAEVHLMYSNRLSYNGNGVVLKTPDTVFGSQSHSVEILKQVQGGSDSELIYAATNYSLASGEGSSINVPGEKLLVSVPLTVVGTDTNQLEVTLVYYKILDKDGNVVAEFNLYNNPRL